MCLHMRAVFFDVSANAYLANDEQVADFTATTGDKLCSISESSLVLYDAEI